MKNLRQTRSRLAIRLTIPLFLLSGLSSSAGLGGDLSKYRSFQLGTDLTTVAKQAGADPSQTTVLHLRPALIQELQWHPRPLGRSSQREAAQDVLFTFYNGELFRIVVNYDRYETEGLTADDFVDAISATYGPAAKPTAPAKVTTESYGDQEDILAQWQDAKYRLDLIRSSYGPSFRLVAVVKALAMAAEVATLEAKRLDDREAPQRDAARVASESEAAKIKLEKARVLNKPNFRL
jgi:hypothetical protein